VENNPHEEEESQKKNRRQLPTMAITMNDGNNEEDVKDEVTDNDEGAM
jgi:hypothetical protein